MKLLRFGNPGGEKPGALVDGKRKDLSLHFRDWDRTFFQNSGLSKLEILLQDENIFARYY